MGEKIPNSSLKIIEFSIIMRVNDLFTHELPKSFNQIEIGRIRRQMQDFDFGMLFKPLFECRIGVVTGIMRVYNELCLRKKTDICK